MRRLVQRQTDRPYISRARYCLLALLKYYENLTVYLEKLMTKYFKKTLTKLENY